MHNWAFVLGVAYVFGEGWAFNISATLLGFIGITLINSKKQWKKPSVKVNPEKMGDYLSFGSGGLSDPKKEPDDDKNKKVSKSKNQKNSTESQSKERKQNKISKSEFSKKIKKSYQKLPDCTT